MKNRCMIRMYSAILALLVSAIVLLPEALFAKGAVIGYASGDGDEVTNEQLNRLTHVMAVDLYPDAQGYLYSQTIWRGPSQNEIQRWNPNQVNDWLSSLVERAHDRGVKVSIVISHNKNFNYISTATQAGNRTNFVNQIVSFVTQYKLDGVDLDWEGTLTAAHWEQYVALLNELKREFPCKRISIALGMKPSSSRFLNQVSIPKNILAAADAIHLMTYDGENWPTHSYADSAKNVINAWANLNPSLKERLHIGCAFYGYTSGGNGNPLVEPKVPYTRYSGGGNYNPGDTPGTTGSAAAKVNYCYDNGYGGVMIWELGYDANITTTPTLLNAIWGTTDARGGYPITITITTHPAASTSVTQGSISGSLSVAASTAKCIDYPFYQWYSNTTNSNTGGTKISGATNANFPIPTTLTVGTYYYFCEMKSGKSAVRSNVAKVTVTAPLVISGPNFITSDPAVYSLNTAYPVTWSVTPVTTPGFQIQSGQNTNSVTIKTKYQYPEVQPIGTITATVQLPNNTTQQISKSIKGILPVTSINGPDRITGASGYGGYNYHANYAPSPLIFSTANYEWTIEPSYSATSYQIAGALYLFFLQSGQFVISCRATADGYYQEYPARKYVYYSSYASYASAATTYPNPASNSLNIEINQEVIAQAKALEQSTTSAWQLKTDPTYDIRLYDGQGNLLRNAKTKGGSVQFNVANLKNGIYYLHIYDGVNEKPEIRQIMVEH